MSFARLRRVVSHPISQNVLALSWVQIATFLVPLATLPYLSRVLGSSAFGLVVFAQGFSIILTLLIDWGFTYDGVREVAARRDQPAKLGALVARIRSAQLLLLSGSALVALAVLFAVPKLSQHPAFLALAWVAAAATALTPNWYFLGMERLKLAAILQLGFRVAAAALTFVLVKSPQDAWIVIALYALSSLGMWAVLDVLMYREVSPRLAGLRAAWASVRGAGPLFVGTVAAMLYTSFNVVLLGLLVSSAEVAYFGAAERIVRASLLVTAPIGVAVYPRLAFLRSENRHQRARQLLVVAMTAVGGIGLVLAAVLAVFSPLIIRLVFGHAFVAEGAPILRVLALVIPLNILCAVVGSWLMTLHVDRLIAKIVLRAGLLNVALGIVLTLQFGPIGMAWSVVAAELACAAGGLWAVYEIDRSAEVRLLPRWRGRARSARRARPVIVGPLGQPHPSPIAQRAALRTSTVAARRAAHAGGARPPRRWRAASTGSGQRRRPQDHGRVR
jgi:PST family polysaccharide transporter